MTPPSSPEISKVTPNLQTIFPSPRSTLPWQVVKDLQHLELMRDPAYVTALQDTKATPKAKAFAGPKYFLARQLEDEATNLQHLCLQRLRAHDGQAKQETLTSENPARDQTRVRPRAWRYFAGWWSTLRFCSVVA